MDHPETHVIRRARRFGRLRVAPLFIGLLFCCGGLPPAHASGVLKTVARFDGANGSAPQGRLVLGADGQFYGTTSAGGTFGFGTVFKLTPSGTLTALAHFNGVNGRRPLGGLIQGLDGNFYGTTSEGGRGGGGTLFKMAPSGAISTLVHFDAGQGLSPNGELVQASDGVLYGTTRLGGRNGHGTVFKVTPAGQLTTLVHFDRDEDGAFPESGLVESPDGTLYGMTTEGGGGNGTLFKVTPQGDVVILHRFALGYKPVPVVVPDREGGVYYAFTGEFADEPGQEYIFTGRIYANGQPSGSGFAFPVEARNLPYGGLLAGEGSIYYGTTFSRFARSSSVFGTLYSIDLRSGDLRTLVTFDGKNGTFPKAGLALGPEGYLYGTTSGRNSPGDHGAVFYYAQDLDTDRDGLSDREEKRIGTNPRKADTDGDKMPDGWEVSHGFDPLKRGDGKGDADKDGLTNAAEYKAGSDPRLADTDSDGLKDGVEVGKHRTDPQKEDTDGDKMPDGWEIAHGFDPLNSGDGARDTDNDGLSNLAEYQQRTNPRSADTDNDGLKDGVEVSKHRTDPKKTDTDGDKMPDGWEVAHGLDPLNPRDSKGDADNDGLSNLAEYERGTDPRKSDTDGDGYSDSFEVDRLKSDPAGPNDVPGFTRVRDPRNPDEDKAGYDVENAGLGYVGQTFEIGTTEVTNLMYAKFLNAVAKTDSLYGLYTTLMGTDGAGGILRSGSSGRYSYKVRPGFEHRPVNFVSLYDALRYINWLHNGMPKGGQNSSTTENGAYKLLGANPRNVVRNAGAIYFLPDQDEWHKAAFFDPDPGQGRPSDSYWPYADQTTTGPGGNFSAFRVQPVATAAGPSHYGTYDQGGNAIEWTESVLTDGKRILSGGRPMIADLTTRETADVGFRVGRIVRGALVTPLVVPELVPVREEFNLGDDTNRNLGRVVYEFQMGKYEVTNADYAAFLNAVAKTDSFYGLYNTRMGTDPQGGITRSGRNGSFKYTVKAGFAKKPVNFITVFSAMRFCNWLHNGAQPGGEIETGAYRLLGNIPSDTVGLRRDASARFFLPDADEWHKAAFYDPSPQGRPTASYWSYAVRADSASAAKINYGGAFGGVTEVDKPGAPSFFGTFGQSGNVAEWTESLSRSKLARIVRGGHYAASAAGVSSSGSVEADPLSLGASIGFRIAAAAGVASPLETGVDRSSPIVQIGFPSSNNPTATKQKMVLRGRANDNMAVTKVLFRVKPPGSGSRFGSWRPAVLEGQGRQRSWRATVRLTALGPWTVQVRSYDQAGNRSAPSEISIRRK